MMTEQRKKKSILHLPSVNASLNLIEFRNSSTCHSAYSSLIKNSIPAKNYSIHLYIYIIQVVVILTGLNSVYIYIFIKVVLILNGLNSALCCKSKAAIQRQVIRKTTFLVVTRSFTLLIGHQTTPDLIIYDYR